MEEKGSFTLKIYKQDEINYFVSLEHPWVPGSLTQPVLQDCLSEWSRTSNSAPTLFGAAAAGWGKTPPCGHLPLVTPAALLAL